MTSEEYPWTRRKEESHPSYEAFKIYLSTRNQMKTAEQLGKSMALISRWSRENEWVERTKAYDVFIMRAQTDGQVEWIQEARTETQHLADKLRRHLSDQLDIAIAKKQDPSVRLSQAIGALVKLQEHACAPIENQKMQDQVDRVAAMLEKVTGGPVN